MSEIRHIPQFYDNSDSHNSALSLILTLRPEWRDSKDTIEFVRFTEGITNTVGLLHSLCGHMLKQWIAPEGGEQRAGPVTG
jgi:hypothetical protein